MKKIIGLFVLLTGILGVVVYSHYARSQADMPPSASAQAQGPTMPTEPPSPTPTALPVQKVLPNDYHVYQSFNNCGPAALSMALSYYGYQVSQTELGQELRPYQNPQGDNDDKSVTLEEVGEHAREYDLVPYLRPNGNTALIKQFIAADIPVVTRTWLQVNEDIGHYRVVKGYDDGTGEFIQDDSLQGQNLRYPYDEFTTLWSKFNYEYLVIVPPEKQHIAERIIGEDVNEQIAWEKAAQNAQHALNAQPDDTTAGFNLSVARYHTGDYQGSVDAFERVQDQLPFRTLWYQIEPIKSYYELGTYDTVFSLTERILTNHNRAFSELYLIRGDMYKKQGNTENARTEYENAVRYNRNLEAAQQALQSL